MTARFSRPQRPTRSLVTWRRGTVVTTAGVIAALAAFVPATAASADTLPSPTSLSMSPQGSCTSATPSTVGDGDLTLYAGIPSSVSPGASATFDVWNTATSATVADGTLSATSGVNAAFMLRQAELEAAANGAITEFSWNATIRDGTSSGPASVTCSFYFDPTRPGTPVITQTASSYTIGTPATFTFSPDTSGSTPVSYRYLLNSGEAAGTVSAGADGTASITITPTSGFNTLTVTAESPGGNPGDTATVNFGAATPPNAADGDLNGDGIPDLVTVGGTAGVPSGLWVAAGKPAADGSTGSGDIVTPATNIGASGDGISGDDSASDFDGAQVITGRFTDAGAQDYLVYYPSGQYAGGGVILQGDDHGGLLGTNPAAISESIPSDTFSDWDPNGDIPLQVANAYNADPNDDADYADLLTISGDATDGYYLEYYQNAGPDWLGSFVLSTATPDGTMDWNDWRIATTEDASGNVDLFLYNSSTGALYLWQNFTVNDSDDTASYTPYEISAKWRPGPISTLRAADINGDGTPDLWTVSPEGRVIGWLVSGLGSKPSISAGHSQSLLNG
jgi:hypothetical protein